MGGQVEPFGHNFLFFMTKAVSNMDICFVKAVLLGWEHGHLILFCLAQLPPPLLIKYD